MAEKSTFPYQFRMIIIVLTILTLFGTLGYSYFGGVSLKESFSITFLTFLGEYDGKLVGTGARTFQLSLKLVGSVAMFVVVGLFFDFILEGKFEDVLKEANIMKRVSKLKNHVIVCGAGRVGSRIMHELKNKGVKYVIIENDPEVASDLKEQGEFVVVDDCLEESSLIKAGVKSAKYLAAVLGHGEKNILLTMTAKELNPKIKVYARAEDEKMVRRLESIKADFATIPEAVSAQQIAEKLV